MGAKNIQPTQEQIAEMQKCHDNENMSYEKIGNKFGWNRHTIAKYLNPKPKLSEKDLKENQVKSVINWRKRTKEKLVEYLGGKCVCCGYNKCHRALQFHHKDPSKKDFQISGTTKSFSRLKEEADKCILVCSNCHAEIHDGIIVP